MVLAVTGHGRGDRGSAGIGSRPWHPAGDRRAASRSPGGRQSVAPAIVADAGRAVTDWASARSLGPSSACGISIALILCAAAWLTAGTRAGNIRAVVTLWAGYLVFLAGRNLLAWPGEGVRVARGVLLAQASVRARTAWLAALGWCLCECAIYAGLAVGAAADRWPGTWTLAIAVLSLTGVRELMTASLGPADPDGRERGKVWRAAEAFVRMPASGRILLIGIVAPVWGSRTVLLALLDWSIIAIGFGLASQQPGGVREARDLRKQEAPDLRIPQRPGTPGPSAPASLAVLLRPAFAGPEGQDSPDQVDAVSPDVGPGAADEQGPETGPGAGDRAMPGRAARMRSRQASLAQAEQTGRLLLLRDDGMLARWMGSPVRGSLLPLPPAVLGLAAIAVLTILGLQNLPSVLFLTPALVMLLAAPGSSNRHAGRLDWLVPPILLGAQLLYFAAIGQAKGIPGPATLALCAAVMLRYADLACPSRPVLFARPRRRTWSMELSETDRERGRALGWEGRMLLMGAAAAAGIGTFAFIALTAYLGMLICAKVLTSSLRLREGSGP